MNTSKQAKPRFELIARKHDRAGFSCGVTALDSFLHRNAMQGAKRDLSQTYVLTRDGAEILGYVTLAAYSIDVQSLPAKARKRLPRHPVPAVLIARLATSVAARGEGHGGRCLAFALGRAKAVADTVGVHVVVTHAKDEQAAAFYAKYGFAPLTSLPLTLFLPVASIR